MSVERVSNDRRAPEGQRGVAAFDDYSLTDEDVLAFLADLRFDVRRSHRLNSGRRLFEEAIDAGLVDAEEVDVLIVELVELRSSGLVGWTPNPHDANGDDLVRATEFHLTLSGRDRLSSAGGP